ncbi:ISAs1 family transposase [Kitasatospora sp. NPDC101155]|uniref:ISAs1 family transposase n=1 Tax=Kitasatospora sp. NPDC101155 TaxID=3364097 RepID=UPI00381983A6
MLVAPSSPMTGAPSYAPSLAAGPTAPDPVEPEGLLRALDRVPDPRDPRGVRYRLATLLAIGVCAMTAAGHNSLVSIGEWARRCDQRTLAALGCPYDPMAGRMRCPDEKTLRDAYGRVDASELTRAGFERLAALARQHASAAPSGLTPHGLPEREQRRAHHRAAERDARPRGRVAFAADGKCLRGAKRPDGTQIYVFSAVRHHDALTAAAREVGAKTNEIPEFQPLMEDIPDEELKDAVVTLDALHAQREHARCLVEERGAHYLLSVKGNQKHLAQQLKSLPWKQIPVLHRTRERGHGREEIREVQVASVNNLLFPHARQVVRIRRRRRPLGTKKWSEEIVYAVTDLPTEQASAEEIAAWARDHWTIENSVHWIRDVVFGEDARTIRTRNAPAIMAGLGDIVRSTLRAIGWANAAGARRAHTDPAAILRLHGIT